MSLPQPNSKNSRTVSSSLLLEEPFTAVQLGLRQLFGRNEAELIQNVNLWLNQPWEDYSLNMSMRVVVDDGRFWVRMPPRMLFDRFTGRARDLSESTLKRTLRSCVDQGVMLVRDDLSDEDEKNVRWVSLIREVLDPQLAIYHDVWKRVIEERLQERQTKKMLSMKREDELWEELQRRLKESRDVLRAAGLFDLQNRYEPVGVQNEPGGYKASNSAVRIEPKGVKMNREGGQNDLGARSKRTGSQVKMNPKTAKPPYRKEIDKETTKVVSEKSRSKTPTTAAPITIENQDFLLEQTNSRGKAEAPRAAPEAAQIALPGTACVSIAPHASPGAVTLARQLLDYACAEGRELTEEAAAQIVLRDDWGRKLAEMTDGAIGRLIGPDWARAGLSEPIGGERKKTLLEDLDRLRWLLWMWPHHRASVEAFYAGKEGKPKPKLNGTFINNARDGIEPDPAWLDAHLAEFAAQKRAGAHGQRVRDADAVWDRLTPVQHEALENKVRERIRTMAGNMDDCHARAQLDLLLDAEFVASLASVVAPTPVTPPVSAPAPTAAPTEPESYQPDEKTMKRLEFHFDKFLARLSYDQHTIEEIEGLALQIGGFARAELLWLADQVKTEWQARLARREAA